MSPLLAMKKIPTWAWLAGAAAILAAWRRKEVISMTGRAIKAGQEQLFAFSLPKEAKPLADVFLRVSREKGVDPFLLVAVAMRESRAGAALRPDGTGDCTPRTWTKDKTGKLYSMPSDGFCWGRGIMQLDWWWHRAWLEKNDWRNPYVNISRGAELLKDLISYFQKSGGPPVVLTAAAAQARNAAAGSYKDPRPLSDDLLYKTAMAAYNTGTYNALMSVAAGASADVTTTGSNYGKSIVAAALAVSDSFTKAIS